MVSDQNQVLFKHTDYASRHFKVGIKFLHILVALLKGCKIAFHHRGVRIFRAFVPAFARLHNGLPELVQLLFSEENPFEGNLVPTVAVLYEKDRRKPFIGRRIVPVHFAHQLLAMLHEGHFRIQKVAMLHDHIGWLHVEALFGVHELDGRLHSVIPSSLLLHVGISSSEQFGLVSLQGLNDRVEPGMLSWTWLNRFVEIVADRLLNHIQQSVDLEEMVLEEEQPNSSKLHEWNILPKAATPACTPEPPTPGSRRRKNYLAPITWTVGDISKAGCLLTIPPQHVDFDDEQEMRRVYSLIYDVFRFCRGMRLEHSIHHVWLLFFDLYHRSFNKRETKVMAQTAKLFDSVGLSYAENALWSQRVRLAAAVARLRIKHNALSLDELLPAHLKDERVTEQAKHSPVTCWVNCIKVSDIKEVTENIEKTFDLRMVSDLESLEKNTFKWDRHCPQVMAFHSSMRGKLARSRFVKTHLLVVQDKSFCRGAATFGKILADLGLTGSVIQTHVNSPRTTAYLATLLTHNEKIKKLMAFSAGRRKLEYEHYFTELGVTNIRIFSDRLIDSPPDAAYMEEVVAVFATPPNSYSAVTDPIDLVCSRGGDLSMLQVLTESDETKEGKQRVMRILEEQKKTLKFAMSRPQIQFVLYETHSELDIENDEMVSKTLKDINRLAKLQHAAVLGKTPMSDLPIDEVRHSPM
ncbi:hypothetical protein D910_11651 [Dendroctonus ponderosae]|uniref:Uncharacterized protein n=1 Tax=Dendroctonus ponderosae TaxID=77166 RepID=U4UVV1_DENPD|nr:hypothetical protein D910_11651 [Dendroctonus ponderosae]